MSHLQLIDGDFHAVLLEELSTVTGIPALRLAVSPDMVRVGDFIAGYQAVRVAEGKHDGAKATIITLADGLGSREVGRLVLRNDALHDAYLEVIRATDDEVENAALTELTPRQFKIYEAITQQGGVQPKAALASARVL